MGKMLRRSVVVIAGSLLLALPAAPVAANAPIIEPLPGEDFVIPAGAMCEFPVSVEFLVNRQKGITFLDDEGNFVRQIQSGALFFRLTNLDDDVSIVLNVSGPGIVTPNPDGSVTVEAHGPWVLFDPFGTHLFNTGQAIFVATFEPSVGAFRIDVVSRVGRSFDLCEALSSEV
jgi:hypothetical protein